MSKEEKKAARVPTLAAELYPELSPEEQNEAVTNLRLYFENASRIAEETPGVEAGLTRDRSVPTVKERSSDVLKT